MGWKCAKCGHRGGNHNKSIIGFALVNGCAYCNSVRSDFIVVDARGKRKIVKEKEKCTHCQ